MTKYLANDDRQKVELMLVEMRLDGAPEAYVRELKEAGLVRTCEHYRWWMEATEDGWRDYIRRRFAAEKAAK